jgi:hypothetical protein
LQTTIDWYREREAHSLRTPGTRQPLALRAVGFAVKQADGVVGRLVP